MKNFIKSISLLLIVAILLVGCGGKDKKTEDGLKNTTANKKDPKKINVGILDDINSIGLVNTVTSNEQVEGLNCEYILYDKPGDLAVDIAKGNLDIATLPADLAANLYNKKDKEIKVGAINTLGLYYIMEHGESIKDVEDLNNQTIYTTGEKSIPTAILNIFINSSNLDNVEIVHKSSTEEIQKLIDTKEGTIAMLPEPLASEFDLGNSSVRKVFDMNDEWSSINIGNPLVTSVIVIRTDFASENPKAVDTFLEMCKDSVFSSRENIDEIAEIIEGEEMLPDGTARNILEDSHIVFIEGEEMQLLMDNYFEQLKNYNAELIGGSIPDGQFYYFRKN